MFITRGHSRHFNGNNLGAELNSNFLFLVWSLKNQLQLRKRGGKATTSPKTVPIDIIFICASNIKPKTLKQKFIFCLQIDNNEKKTHKLSKNMVELNPQLLNFITCFMRFHSFLYRPFIDLLYQQAPYLLVSANIRSIVF